MGKVAVVDNLDGKASLNSGVLLIDLNDKNSKKYLYWVLSSDVFGHGLIIKIQGIAQYCIYIKRILMNLYMQCLA